MQELTKAEEQVMQIIWSMEKGFVKEILAELEDPKPAYNTVSTIVRILEKKGFVGFTAFGKTHQYFPLISRETYKSQLSKSLVSKYFEGSIENLVSFFAKKEEIDLTELDAIIKELKKKIIMNNLLYFLLQANVYLIVSILAYTLFIKKQKNFKFSRFYLLATTFLSVCLPFIDFSILLPISPSTNIVNFLTEIVVIPQHTATNTEFVFNWVNVLLLIYVLGIIFKLIRIFLSFFKLHKIKNQSIKEEDFFLLPNSYAAFSFLNWIFIGASIPKKEREIILAHEKVHVKNGHSIDLLVCQLIESILWFNPVTYQLKNLLEEVHEYEADIKSCHNSEEYISLLLNQSLQQFHFSLIHQFNSNHLKNRIMRIKNQSNRKIKVASVFLSLFLFTAAFFINQHLFSQSEQISKKQSSMEGKTDLEKKAEFPGGQKAMNKFFMERLKYPKNLIKKEVTETIHVEFIIEKDGKIGRKKVLKGENQELIETVMKVLDKMPEWTPAEKDGKKVASSMVLPFKFVLPPPPPPPSPSGSENGFLPGSMNNLRDNAGYAPEGC